ncbi:MAG: ZIP family metal transporter [Burkholderiales bacterium]|nr:ZIP family metal transporter [Burkholderiales bacterium]
MSTLAWITAASLLGGVLSVACAALFALTARAAWVPMLVSYAIGALLGAAFLELLPEAFEGATSVRSVAATILAGIFGFFILEKLVLWRHCHVEDFDVHDQQADAHDHGRSGMLILIGDSFHNFVDGILVAAAFMQDTQLGIVTALAIIAHEIPQEVGDFLILLHSGYSRTRAFMLNLLSSFAMLAGGLIAYYALQSLREYVQTFIALAAASMIYVAVADLIPGLHKRPELRATLSQSVLIALGVSSIWLVGYLTRNYAA